MVAGDWIYLKWVDSYGVRTGWTDLEENYNPEQCLIESAGKIIKIDDSIVAIAHNYADATNDTPRQANGIMVIPREAIKEAISLSSYLRSGSELMPQQP